MSRFNVKWNIQAYKTDYESEEHWNLRRRFMEAHKHKYPEDRLVCLAQVFTNVEFLGCKYPDETMKLVESLSKEVAEEYRVRTVANRLKRTFVKASDAAQDRVKRRQVQKTAKTNHHRKRFGAQEDGTAVTPRQNRITTLMRQMKYGNFVVYLIGGRNCLQVSGVKCSVPVNQKESVVQKKRMVQIFIGDNVVGTGTSDNVKTAKADAFSNAMNHLREHCYFIKPNPNADTIFIKKKNKDLTVEVVHHEDPNKVQNDNVGYKMMMKMGWSGGGLGRNNQGREDPVEYLLKTNRSGLGKTSSELNADDYQKIMTNYLESNDVRDINFDASFTKDDRVLLHGIASTLGLKSTSHGVEDARHLTVSKKTISTAMILEEVLINKTPSYCNKYFVQVPPSQAQEFPDHTTPIEFEV